MSNPIKVWHYRAWCWRCRYGVETTRIYPCDGGGGYGTAGEAADAGREHLREAHGVTT